MGIRFPSVAANARQMCKYSRLSNSRKSIDQHSSSSDDVVVVPKGHVAVYVGIKEEKTRFVVPLSYLNSATFLELLHQAEEEFGFDQPIMGGLTIPCHQDAFLLLISRLK